MLSILCALAVAYAGSSSQSSDPDYDYCPNQIQSPEKEEELKQKIKAFMEEHEIYFYLSWTANYDWDHLYPLHHVLGDNFKWVSGFASDVPNVDFATMPNKVFVKTHDAKNTRNTILLTHGIDEDQPWRGEESKAIDEVRYPLFFDTKYWKDTHGKKYHLIEEDNRFDKNKKTIMVVTTLNYHVTNPSLLCNSEISENESHSPEYDELRNLEIKFKKDLNDLAEHFNVILKTHPNCTIEFPDLLPKVIVDPEAHWMEIVEHIDLLIAESSGATFAMFTIINDREIPLLWACNNVNGIFEKVKEKYDIIDDDHAVIHHADQDLKTHVDEAFKEFEDTLRKQERVQKRKDHLKKMMGGTDFPHVNKEYAEYYTAVHIMKNLDIPKDGKAFEEMIQAYKDLTLCTKI